MNTSAKTAWLYL